MEVTDEFFQWNAESFKKSHLHKKFVGNLKENSGLRGTCLTKENCSLQYSLNQTEEIKEMETVMTICQELQGI